MAYDIAGRLTSYISNGGNIITYDYDKLDSLMEKAYTDALGEESGEPVVYAYDALGERVAMYDSTGDTEYTYDSLGRITSVTTYRTPGEGEGEFSHEAGQGDTVTYTYDGADNLAAITYPDGTKVAYEYDLNDNLIKVTDREGLATIYVYDAINRVTEIHRPNGISTYNTYNGENQITELTNICDDCGWVVSSYAYTYDERGFITGETAIESLAGYAYDDKHDGKHEDGKHDDLYPHGNKHAKHDKDAMFAYQIVETDRTFVYDDAGKLLSATETEDNYGTYIYTYEYDLTGNRTAIVKTDEDGEVAESRKYIYNESSQLISVELFDGKKTTSVSYTYDADGNLISETGRDGTDKVELTSTYTVENRLEAVYDGKELLMAAAYDGDGNRVFQLNYNLHTDEDWKGNSGNGNGSNKDNAGSGSSGSDSSGSSGDDGSNSGDSEDDSSSSNGNGNGNSGNNGNGKNNGNTGNNGNGNSGSLAKTEDGTAGEEGTDAAEDTTGTGDTTTDDDTIQASEADGDTSADSTSTGNGNATNAETNNSQNQCGILFPIDSETSDTESYLISLIKTSGKEKNYELIEYINDVNREYTEVLVEQNINGALDTAYVYGAAIGSGSDRLSLNRFDGSTGYYLYDPRGSVTGITNEEGQVYQSYRYSAFGEITFGAPQYENEYTYNGESYNPNIRSQYLRARYYYVVTAAFLTEDSYLGDITEPLTLNRYNYCVSSPVNYADPSGNTAIPKWQTELWWEFLKEKFLDWWNDSEYPVSTLEPIPMSPTPTPTLEMPFNLNDVLTKGGVAQILDSELSTEEYLELANKYAESKAQLEWCEITFNQGLYENNTFYRTTADYISQINNQDIISEEIFVQIQEVYERQKAIYEKISEESGYFPPELIAAIHYRENAGDYFAESFGIYLHNGDMLGEKSEKQPKPDLFDVGQFDEAALDALKGWDGQSNYIENRAKNLGLTPDSKDITAMVTLSVFYNGWDKSLNGKTSYAYNGTNIYEKGLYVSDGVFDPDKADQNYGTYLVLLRLLTQD